MICLRCNHNNDDNAAACVSCGADMYINEKTKNIAIKLYNRGLFLARERKLSEAAELLNRSLYFDRFSIDARNMLGLIYFELGMIADALRQWAISASFFGGNNYATVYLARIKDSVREMEKMDDAVKMYNQGLVNIKNKNDDMAVIQLKKAIELNPKLIEAKNLLALIYMSENNSSQAVPIIDAVCAYDINNEKALSYKSSFGKISINTQKYRQQAKYEPVSAKQQFDPYIQKKVKRFGKFPLSEAVCLLLGAACAVAVMYILVIPSIVSSGNADLVRLQGDITTMQSAHAKEITEKDAENEQLKTRIEELERANDEIGSRTALMQKQQQIMTAVSLNAAGNIKEAAAILKEMDLGGLTDADISQYNSVKDAVFPQMAKTCFDEGRIAFNGQNYVEAKNSFLQGIEYGMIESNAGDAYYFLGRIAENDGDLISAKQNYEKTVNEFSACTQYYNATNRLNAITR